MRGRVAFGGGAKGGRTVLRGAHREGNDIMKLRFARPKKAGAKKFTLPALRLRGKIFAIAGLTLVAMAAVAGIYFYQNVRIEAASAAERSAAAAVTGVTEAAAISAAIKANVSNLVLTPSQELIDLVNADLNRAKQFSTDYPGEDILKIGLNEFQRYADVITATTAAMGLEATDGFTGKLAQSVAEVERLMIEEVDRGLPAGAAVLTDLMRLELTQKEFMLNRDMQMVKLYNEQSKALTGRIGFMPIPKERQAAIGEALQTYETDFRAYVTATRTVRDALASLNLRADSFGGLGAKRLAGLEATRSAAQAVLASERDTLSSALYGAVGVAALACCALAMLIGRSIERPVTRLERVMRQIAEGKNDTEVPYQTRRDEVGDMARALQVFRQNALQLVNMTDEQQVANQQRREERAAMMLQLQRAFGEVVDAAAHGDFSQRVGAEFPDAELNALAERVNMLVETVDRGLAETGEVLAAMAQTDLTRRVTGHYHGAFEKLKTDTNMVADRVAEIVGQLRQTSRGLKVATSEILSGSNDLAERTTRQAASIEETSAAMERLAGTVSQNVERAEQAATTSKSATSTAEDGGRVMQQASGAMERITQSSAKISNIIGLIDDIAFQTNLLALNASVEAARAGEAGKGFAVVAVEVRRLAQSAAQASSDVKVLIEESAREVGGGVKLVNEASGTLERMLEAVKQTSTLVEGIARDSREQANAIEEASDSVRQMDEMTQQNAALVEQTNAAIEQTEGQADELDRIVGRFTLDEAEVEQPEKRRPNPVAGLKQRLMAGFGQRGNAALAVDPDWQEF